MRCRKLRQRKAHVVERIDVQARQREMRIGRPRQASGGRLKARLALSCLGQRRVLYQIDVAVAESQLAPARIIRGVQSQRVLKGELGLLPVKAADLRL